MDFESCFTDCCMACNSLCPNFKTSSKIRGQGDCKDSINFQEHQDYWVKEKSLRNEFQHRCEFKKKQQENQLNTYNNHFCKNNKNEDFLDKIKHETKCEKKDIEIFQNCNIPWNSPYANWTNNKIKESSDFEDLKNNENLNRERLVAETISELKEKVEFLFKNLKVSNPKIFNDSYHEKSHGDYAGISGEVSHLFDINKRLNIAEESIKKLTSILEYLLVDNKKKTSFFNKNLIFSEPLNFEEMPITQRINLLKNRNDFLFDFMRDFLQVRSIEELYSMDLMPRAYELNQNPWNSTFSFAEQNQSNGFNRENVMEILKELKRQVSKENNETPQEPQGYQIRNEKRGENTTKCYRNKLEVISEQAELAFFYDNENADSKKFKTKSSEFLKEKLAEVKQESIENSGISEKTSRLLAQEAMLKSSLDRGDFEIFLNGDPSEKNYTFTKNSPVSLTSETPTEKNNERDDETSLDSSRSFFWESEKIKKSKIKSAGKYPIHEEQKKKIKNERNLEATSSSLPKRNTCIKQHKPPEPKNQSFCKVLQQKSHTLLRPTFRPNKNGCYLPEIRSPPQEETKTDLKIKNQRPMTTPGFHSKTLQTSGIRAVVPDNNRKKISGINNVKNKNKHILSQKSCVRTA